MFLGTGAGNDDLCIIAQGKVDVLLQASSKDRRTIFEEAAGISRFKAKKIETLRKLERVDQNLSRVKDIIDEVEKQLRSVKLQASKAQRFQEHSDRLKELRVSLGLIEYREITQKLDAQTQALDALKAELDQRAARAGACEAEAERLEMLLADLDDQLH
jgi:chromosome segregation protein